MEITELNLISEFEAGMNWLQNPSLISRVFSHSFFGEIQLVPNFWKWGALILALVATFSGIIIRIKRLIVRHCKTKLLASSGSKTQELEHDYDEDDDDSTCSLVSSDDHDEGSPTTSFHDRTQKDEDFSVAGSSCNCDSRDLRLRRRRRGEGFSWSDFAGGKSVVKLWDSFGLGLDFEEDDSESVVSVWDLNKDRRISSFSGGKFQIPAVFTASPGLIYSAGSNSGRNVFLKLYDTRSGCQIPAICADWLPRWRKVAAINAGGVEKVYVRDDVTGGLTVGDMRNVKTPLESLTESDEDTWWDADAAL